jgi:perosamine synthetase
MKIAKNYKLEVVEDSCETMFVNKLEGTTACFSTYVAHLMVTGVGGFILTNDDKLAITMRSMLFHGRDESYLNIDDKPKEIWKRFHFPRHGYSDRMTELEAAIGLGDLDNWENMIESAKRMPEYLMGSWMPAEVYLPRIPFNNHSFMFFPAYAERRDELMVYLEENGIQTRTMMPLISQPITKPLFKRKIPYSGIHRRQRYSTARAIST